MSISRYYTLALPVYKQGDDMRYRIEKNKDLPSAFKDQAEVYEEAARMCRRMASVAAEVQLEVFADTHVIQVDSDDILRLEALVGDGILDAQEWDDGEDDLNDSFEGETAPETDPYPPSSQS